MIPGNIFQSQRDTTANSIARNQVEIGKISDNLQHRTDSNILEIQGKFFTDKSESRAFFLEFPLAKWFDAHHVLFISLVNEEIVVARRFQGNLCGTAVLTSVYGGNGRRKICDFQTPVQ